MQTGGIMPLDAEVIPSDPGLTGEGAGSGVFSKRRLAAYSREA